MGTTLNESLVREIVQEVLGKLGGAAAPPAPAAGGPLGPRPVAPAAPRPAPGARHHGLFEDVDQACQAAQRAFEQLLAQGVAARLRAVEIVKALAEENAQAWGKLELEETRIGRLDHKIEKLQLMRRIPGVEFLRPEARSGDHGITLEELTPFGVIGAVTPSTHSVPTVTANAICMLAAGNAVVFNPHPGAARCAAVAVRAYNRAIERELGIEDLICLLEGPTLEGFQALSRNALVRLLCITGGPGVVKAAMISGKRAICGGPGNPPVLVDDTVDLDQAARKIIQGAAYDNNLLCIGEKQVFVLASVADGLLAALGRNGGHRLTGAQLERLTRAAFTFPPGQGGGCSRPAVNRELVGRDPAVLAREAGAEVPAGTQLLFAETDADQPFVQEEQMMPVLPVVRVRTVEEGIAEAKRSEHDHRHTAIIHSHDVTRMTAMARALDTTLFVKNGPCVAGLGAGGEGYPTFTIATPTGEGVTNPRTFTRVRRCTMVDNLRIY
jgi:aldehyde dehydrogenase